MTRMKKISNMIIFQIVTGLFIFSLQDLQVTSVSSEEINDDDEIPETVEEEDHEDSDEEDDDNPNPNPGFQFRPGGGGMVFKPPALTEEEAHSKFMPREYKCDACIAISYQMEHDAFPKAEKKKKKGEWLKTSDIIIATENLCANGFESYGLKNLMDGKKALSGPGLANDKAAGMMEGGGKWQSRILSLCKELVEWFEEDGLYELYKNRGTKKLANFLCTDLCRGKDKKKLVDEL